MKNLELIVGELPVFINNDNENGFMGRAHIRMRNDSPESTITITLESDAAQALADMMVDHDPMGISFVYIKSKAATDG